VNDSLKISGKKLELPKTSQQEWKFTLHSGGWVVAESKTGVRRKVMMFEHQGRFSASVRGYLWFGEWIQQSREMAGAAGDSDLVAQFPGKVRKVLVKVGAMVLEGDSLILVEAMKMEFSVRAPFAGKVIQILVQEGQQVLPGERLVDLEEAVTGGN
jgi:biotin carboxyl carrier protein